MKRSSSSFPSRRRMNAKSLLATVIGLLITLVVLASEAMAPVRLPQGHGPVELYSNQAGDDLRGTVLKAIASADHSILMAIYNLSDAKIIAALKSKAESGVPVTVIVDAKASPKAQKLLGPLVKTLKRSPTGLMHLKILVIDSKQVWIGSANMSFASLRTHGNMIVAMDNPSLATRIDSYLRAMPQIGAVTVAAPKPIRFAQEGQDGDLWFLPDMGPALPKLLELIDSAKMSLKVAMFTWTHPKLTEAIIRAHHRGVHVTAVIDNNQGTGTGAEVVHKLRQAGILTYLSKGEGLLHYKMAIIDDAILVMGSANWTRSAFARNDDCFLVLSPLSTDQQDYLGRTWGVIVHESDRGLIY